MFTGLPACTCKDCNHLRIIGKMFSQTVQSQQLEKSTSLSQANTTFSLALLKKLNEDKTANVFFSPFSISSALAMVMLGARGDTAAQISKCLSTQDVQNVHVGFARLLNALNESDAPNTLSVANRLYGEKCFKFLKDYMKSTKELYNAELEPVDFRTAYEAVRAQINGWVEEQTQGKIKDLLADGTVSNGTILVLVNAIYFKGTWNEPFMKFHTNNAEFRITKNERKPVKMMTQKTNFPYSFSPEANCQILEMPYKGKELSMLIFLPKEIEDDTTGLEKLQKLLTYEKFVEWTCPDRMNEVEVEVKLPRFKLEEKYDLEDVLKSRGMVDAFDARKSDLSGMSETRGLTVSKVVHKAFVEVNEEGTEAAAATGVVVSLTSINTNLLTEFTADHPFLFFIRHNTTKTILFAGRFCSPE